MGDFFSCFWKCGYGSHPDFPIAGYTWFLRDLFVFALLSPIYNYCYKRRNLAVSLLVILCICDIVPEWNIPGFNTWIYVGGFIANRKLDLETICNKMSNWVCLILFFIVNIVYYRLYHCPGVHFILVISSFIVVFKLTLFVHHISFLNSLAASSTYLYVTHIFVLNVTRHSLAKVLTVRTDIDMCLYYILNSVICVVICISTYYILKRLKASFLLKIITGGRA